MPVNDFHTTVREVLRSHLTKRALDINPMLLGAGAGGLGGLGVANQMPGLFKAPPGGDMIDKLTGAMNGKPQG
jgi:hypothetical protein